MRGSGEAASMHEILGLEKLVTLTGIRGGVSMPVRGPGGLFGYVVYTSHSDLEGLLCAYADAGDALFVMAYHFYEAIAERLSSAAASEHGLTAREIECLSLVAVGKTLEEVAEIIGRSYSTVRFHLHNAEQKLGTGNRSHTIAKAASMGLFDLP